MILTSEVDPRAVRGKRKIGYLWINYNMQQCKPATLLYLITLSFSTKYYIHLK